MPVAEATRELVQRTIDSGHTECDFGILLEQPAEASGIELQSEDVDDGLHGLGDTRPMPALRSTMCQSKSLRKDTPQVRGSCG